MKKVRKVKACFIREFSENTMMCHKDINKYFVIWQKMNIELLDMLLLAAITHDHRSGLFLLLDFASNKTCLKWGGKIKHIRTN